MSSRRRHFFAVLVGALTLVLSIAQPAAAHEGDEGTESFLFVRQAIALIVNTPDAHEAIADKINDAIEAPDTHGVDVGLVEEAQVALEAEDIHGTRSLLEQSIGAQPHLGSVDPVPAGEHVDDAAAESVVEPFLDPLDTSRDLDVGTWMVMAGALILVAAGTVIAVKLRPVQETT